MAGQLVQVATETISSATASVTLTGINTDDVYMCAVNNLRVETDIKQWGLRITKSGTADVTANYDFATKNLRANTSFANNAQVNLTFYSSQFLGTGTGEAANFILYCYNFNSSSEFSFMTLEEVVVDYATNNIGSQGGIVHTVASASDGLHFFEGTGTNLLSGTFTLYKVV